MFVLDLLAIELCLWLGTGNFLKGLVGEIVVEVPVGFYANVQLNDVSVCFECRLNCYLLNCIRCYSLQRELAENDIEIKDQDEPDQRYIIIISRNRPNSRSLFGLST